MHSCKMKPTFLRSFNTKQYFNILCSYAPVIGSSFKLRASSVSPHDVHQFLPCRSLWCSPVLCKRRKTREERKNPTLLVYTPKKLNAPVIGVWQGITVKELAKVCERSVDSVLEALSYDETEFLYFRPSSQLTDFKIIQRALKRLGMKMKIIANPSQTFQFDGPLEADIQRRHLKPHVELVPRPPVVTVMGHVDHGKTSLLDALRNSNVVASEFGGITQHIGAFQVKLSSGAKVTFLDTPGHAAFKAMRNRGAQCTDIVVLVVAADDGVMEQTLESIKMANDAQVPMIIAINKIDKHGANIEKTKQMLINNHVMLEEAGGDTQVVPISAKQKLNLDKLVEAISVQAQVMDLRADYEGLVEGVIIESKIDPHRGKLATVLVQHGTLKKGDILIAGLAWAKVRNMFDESRTAVTSAPPSFPVEVMGWRDLPQAGDIVLEVETEAKARQVLEFRHKREEEKKIKEDLKVIEAKREEHHKIYQAEVEERRKMGFFKTRRVRTAKQVEEEFPHLNILVKGDVAGSVEAIINVIGTYYDPRCRLDVVSEEVGAVSLSDVEVAQAFDAIIYAFNVDTFKDAKVAAEKNNVTIKNINVIYKVIDDLKEELSKRLPVEKGENIIGEAVVQQNFFVTENRKKCSVAGCRCTTGNLKKSEKFKVVRDGKTVLDGMLLSMKHFKNEVGTIKENLECGLMFEDTEFEFLPGDKIVCYSLYDIPQKIRWDPGF